MLGRSTEVAVVSAVSITSLESSETAVPAGTLVSALCSELLLDEDEDVVDVEFVGLDVVDVGVTLVGVTGVTGVAVVVGVTDVVDGAEVDDVSVVDVNEGVPGEGSSEHAASNSAE
jgi:hypothetical protein